MTICLGFGITEKEFEQQEIDWIDDFIKENGDKSKYFDDDFAEFIENNVKSRALNYRQQSEKYKNLDKYECPERYSSYYVTILYDDSHIVVIFSLSHINRQHALSPDGWGMMMNERLHLIKHKSIR